MRASPFFLSLVMLCIFLIPATGQEAYAHHRDGEFFANPGDVIWPIDGAGQNDLSSPFGPRIKASEDRYDFHRGIDIPAPVGTPVLAIADGEARIPGGFSDTTIQVEHTKPGGGTFRATYLHLTSIPQALLDCMAADPDGRCAVIQGETVGFSGESAAGFAHLHFEIRDEGFFQPNAINPFEVLPYTDTTNEVTISEITDINNVCEFDSNDGIPLVNTQIQSDFDDSLIRAKVISTRNQLDFDRVEVNIRDLSQVGTPIVASETVDLQDWNALYTAETNDAGTPDDERTVVLDSPRSDYACTAELDGIGSCSASNIGNPVIDTAVTILPCRFSLSESQYEIDFLFRELALPGGVTSARIEMRALDIHGNESTATTFDVAPDISASPSSHDFGSVAVGNTATAQTFTISNTGTGDLSIGSLALSGANANVFTLSNDTCSSQTITAGNNCTVDANVSPTAEGVLSASLDIPSDDADTPTLSAALSATATGGGGADTTPPLRSSPVPSGTLASGTTQTTISLETDENATCRYSLTANTDFTSMTEAFDTTGTTSHSTLVTGLSDGNTFAYFVRCEDGASNANTDDLEISFSIASTPIPNISISPVSHAFGTITIGNQSSQTFTISNDGNADLSITSVSSDNAVLSVSSNSCDGQTLAALEDCAFTVVFQPSSGENSSAIITISSNDQDTPSAQISVSGQGNIPSAPEPETRRRSGGGGSTTSVLRQIREQNTQLPTSSDNAQNQVESHDTPEQNTEKSEKEMNVLEKTTTYFRQFFRDIPPRHRIFLATAKLASADIINGYDAKSGRVFLWKKHINRAEFIKTIIALRFPPEEISTCLEQNTQPHWTYTFFRDVDINAWYSPHVCMATIHEIVVPDSNSLLFPSEDINASNGSNILLRTFFPEEGNTPNTSKGFERIREKNILPSNLNDPNAPLTRGETIMSLIQILTQTDLDLAILQTDE